METLKIKKLRDGAKFNSATELDSGFDVVALAVKRIKNSKIGDEVVIENEIIIQPHETVLLSTGIALELPKPIDKGEYMEIVEAQARPRSGASLKESKVAILGTIDNQYRGEIGIIMNNTSNKPIVIKKGERVAQVVLNVIRKYKIEYVDSLNDTKRGANGFGSSGK